MQLPEEGSLFQVYTNGPAYRGRRPEEHNAIDFSSFRQLNMRLQSRGFSVKYVLQGTERYSLRGKYYPVVAGRYLLSNAFTACEVTIDGTEPVRGVCMELSPELLTEVFAVLCEPGKPFNDNDYYDFLSTARFFENDYNATNTHLGHYLQQTVARPSLAALMDGLWMRQFFYSLAERVIADQREVHKYIGSLATVKDSTRKDLLHRLLKGKELMDDLFTTKLSIAEMAKEAAMSEYYFLRLFRQAFGCTPHRYLVDLRLAKAQSLLYGGHDTITSIAAECGFTDVYAFSKSYKQRFGRSPSRDNDSDGILLR